MYGHFATWILLWLFQHRVKFRKMPLKTFACEIFVYWVVLGFFFGYMLYRPDYELASSLKDDLFEMPQTTMALLGTTFLGLWCFNLYYH